MWISGWELECCVSDAIVGEEWIATAGLAPEEPWWQEHAVGPLPEEVRRLGVTAFDAEVAPGAAGAAWTTATLDGGGSVAVPASTAPGRRLLRGRLFNEAHGGLDPVDEEVELTGVVQRVRAIRYELALRDGFRVPVAQLEPEDLEATGTNRLLTTHRTYRHEADEYLVDLRVGAQVAMPPPRTSSPR